MVTNPDENPAYRATNPSEAERLEQESSLVWGCQNCGHRNPRHARRCIQCDNPKDQAGKDIKKGKDEIDPQHYNRFEVEPATYVLRNRIPGGESDVIYYVTRHEHKGGATDLEKAVRWLVMILKERYGVELEVNRKEK